MSRLFALNMPSDNYRSERLLSQAGDVPLRPTVFINLTRPVAVVNGLAY